LLKTIEEKRFRRVGDTAVRTSDFRLICATNRDLEAECGAGRFRRDLFYRISVFPITLPPLRECSMDLAELAAHLLAELGRPDVVLSEVVLALFRGYPWPGNVRELRNALERALLLAGPLPLAPVHFAALQVSTEAPPATVPGPENWDAEQAEMLHLRSALERFGGDMTKAARALGISRSTLYRKLKRRLDS